MSLMPCFSENQAPTEGIIIGRLLAGYGELEVSMLACLIAIEGQMDTPVRQLFSTRGEQNRITTANKSLVADFTKAGLQVELAEAIDEMDWCRQIRNQYAHCQWCWTPNEGLCFVDLEALAKDPNSITSVTDNRRQISILLLQEQERFFNYVKETFVRLWLRSGPVPS